MKLFLCAALVLAGCGSNPMFQVIESNGSDTTLTLPSHVPPKNGVRFVIGANNTSDRTLWVTTNDGSTIDFKPLFELAPRGHNHFEDDGANWWSVDGSGTVTVVNSGVAIPTTGTIAGTLPISDGGHGRKLPVHATGQIVWVGNPYGEELLVTTDDGSKIDGASQFRVSPFGGNHFRDDGHDWFMTPSSGTTTIIGKMSDEEYVKQWNKYRSDHACSALAGNLIGKAGDHVVCSNSSESEEFKTFPRRIPEGYKVTFYTSGCPTCAVGWVLKKGVCGDTDRNCSD